MKVYAKVKTGASEKKVINFGNFRYLVYVKARPENNEANIELINTLSKTLGVPASSIKITAGLTNPDKILEIR